MSSNKTDEPSFTIQPIKTDGGHSNHPPGFTQGGSEQTAGLGGAPNLAHLPKGPLNTGVLPPSLSKEMAESLEQPKTREELQAEASKLN